MSIGAISKKSKCVSEIPFNALIIFSWIRTTSAHLAITKYKKYNLSVSPVNMIKKMIT